MSLLNNRNRAIVTSANRGMQKITASGKRSRGGSNPVLRKLLSLLVIGAALIWAVTHICHEIKAFDAPTLFDAKKVTITPGIFICCSLCKANLYNLTDPDHACWTALSPEPFCLACHATGGLKMMVKCPGCEGTYAPELNVNRTPTKNAGRPQISVNCAIKAVCPTCGHQYLEKSNIIFYEE